MPWTNDELDALLERTENSKWHNETRETCATCALVDAITALRRDVKVARAELRQSQVAAIEERERLTAERDKWRARALLSLDKAEAFDTLVTGRFHVGYNSDLKAWVVWRHGSAFESVHADLAVAVQAALQREGSR